jgi:hypothetical protein
LFVCSNEYIHCVVRNPFLTGVFRPVVGAARGDCVIPRHGGESSYAYAFVVYLYSMQVKSRAETKLPGPTCPFNTPSL